MDKTMQQMRNRFSDAREKCPGMSEDIYQLADYLAKHINEEVVPSGVTIALFCAIDDIKKGCCGFGGNCSFPDYLIEHKYQVLAQACYIIQIVDAVTDADFADDVRIECKDAFNWQVPKRVSVSDDKEEYPAYVKAAVDWWAEAIQHPRMDDGDDTLPKLMATFGGPSLANNFTEETMKDFRSTLATGIISEIEKEGGCMFLDVDYRPDRILNEAGQAAGITRRYAYPFNTRMSVSKDEVTVSAGYAASHEIIWKAV